VAAVARPLPDGTKASIAYGVGAPGNQCTVDHHSGDSTHVAPEMGTGTYVLFRINIDGGCNFEPSKAPYKIGPTSPNGLHIGDVPVNVDQGPANIIEWPFTATCGYNTRPHLVRCQPGQVTQLKGGEGKNGIVPFDLDVIARS
jgi:hypothetical protein